MLWEVLDLKRIYFFADSVTCCELKPFDRMCHKIIHLYRRVLGSTNLQAIFDQLAIEKDNGDDVPKMNLILTDGDCDPNKMGHNPFNDALIRFPKDTFCVYNLKSEALAFPY